MSSSLRRPMKGASERRFYGRDTEGSYSCYPFVTTCCNVKG